MKKFLRKYKKWIFIILVIIILLIAFLYYYDTAYLDSISDIQFTLNGKKEIVLNLGEEYQEEGVKASFREEVLKDIIIKNPVDNTKIGEYIIEYEIHHKGKHKKETRKVIIVDQEPPTIELNGDEKISLFENEIFDDPKVKVIDNYDGDISEKVSIQSNLDTSIPGEYTITYSVEDSSGNKSTITRMIEVKKKSIIKRPGVAVLNYHFFYENETCNEHICLSTSKFEEQLKYLNDNGYKTLTMEEFVKWIYNEIDIPEKSVLLTIDDGALGTGFHNGNHLIPLLEKYNAHATLFLITGWWDINNYRSPNLDIESHTNDMHNESYCSGVMRGARMLCSTHEEALEDLKKSIEIIGSKKAFCYPFYAYNEEAISIVKEAGFQVAFAGGNYKATKNSNKYTIPRFPIYRDITLETFIRYIS